MERRHGVPVSKFSTPSSYGDHRHRQQQHQHHHLHRTSREFGSHQLYEVDLEDDESSPDRLEAPEDTTTNKVLLYGKLQVWIGRGKNIPHTGPFSEHMPQCCSYLTACKIKTSKKMSKKFPTRSGIYVLLSLSGARLARTVVTKEPVWKEDFTVLVAHIAHEVLFSIKEEGIFGPRVVGRVRIPAKELVGAGELSGWFPVLGLRSKYPVKKGAELEVSVRYISMENDQQSYKLDNGVPNVYFPLRKGCRAVLYQDAHVNEQETPIRLGNGTVYIRRRCWEELCRAILEAHHLIYIIGWAVYDQTRLVRGNSDLPEMTLGELLKSKAAEGVRVLLLVWDDKTSHHNRFFKLNGVMGTHDEETKRFFKHSSVKCVLSPRYGDSKLSWFRQKLVGTLYTHHQKTVLVDTQGPGNTRKITAFLGGLDLCDGRFDTPEHSLFETLDTVHKDDCYNAMLTLPDGSKGPRQPWHDQHCMIDGPAAYDVLTNFEQRWRKTCRRNDDQLVRIDRISWILGPITHDPQKDEKLKVTRDDDPETWHAQIFRSIDSGSVEGFPKTVRGAREQNLTSGKHIAIEKSIETAYVDRIRSAQHFIYIENQYFLGSSYAWPKYKNAGATHLIPMELALKIATKIRHRERFAVYIVVPMWPEGSPDSASGQEILFFQSQTMQMMYTIVADALKETGLDKEFHPRDYLNFYCLGKREVPKIEAENPPSEKSKQRAVQQNGRFLIYVHAKSMIVDDTYVIIGSANINQRSMDGCRDTEIAMGAFQPHYTSAKSPRGQVYGHRMSLWLEHLACLRDSFSDPKNLETVREVNQMAEENWQQYVSEEVTYMKAHLLPYPLKVNQDGSLEPLEGFECFPDLGGKVMGAPQVNLPDAVTS